MKQWKETIQSFDIRRDIVICESAEKAIAFAIDQLVDVVKESVAKRGTCCIALSGGSTPVAIFKSLASAQNRLRIPWENVKLFWSDERCVSPQSKDSNFGTAAHALAPLNLKESALFRMKGEGNPEEAAKEYEDVIRREVPEGIFDLVMLGVGEDGHTASLFPETHGLHVVNRATVANYIPQKDTWRLTLTFDCINKARYITIYALGMQKAAIINKVLTSPLEINRYPVQNIGTPEHKALWLLDKAAAEELIVNMK